MVRATTPDWRAKSSRDRRTDGRSLDFAHHPGRFAEERRAGVGREQRVHQYGIGSNADVAVLTGLDRAGDGTGLDRVGDFLVVEKAQRECLSFDLVEKRDVLSGELVVCGLAV